VRAPADLARQTLLVFAQAGERFAQLSWARWHERLGLPPPGGQARFLFSQYEDLLRACVQGMGVAIGLLPLVQPRLRGGELQAVLPEHAVDGPCFRLLLAPASAQRPEVQAFCGWLRKVLAEEAA
ncbi:MAG: LysR substrate-binding domain-containing protein, partial [Xenophilus sp.]